MRPSAAAFRHRIIRSKAESTAAFGIASSQQGRALPRALPHPSQRGRALLNSHPAQQGRPLPPSTADRRTGPAISSDGSKPARPSHFKPRPHTLSPKDRAHEYRWGSSPGVRRPDWIRTPSRRRFRLPDDGASERTNGAATDHKSGRRSHSEPRPHTLSPKDRAQRIPTRLEVRSALPGLVRTYLALTGSEPPLPPVQVAGRRQCMGRAGDGPQERTTRAGDSPTPSPAAHFEPEGQGSMKSDGAQSAGIRRRPDV